MYCSTVFEADDAADKVRQRMRLGISIKDLLNKDWLRYMNIIRYALPEPLKTDTRQW